MDDAFLDDNQEHQHDSRVSSVGIDVAGEVVQQKLNEWIGWLLWEKGVDLFRSKGVLAVKGMRERFVFQAIHMLFANSQGNPWKHDEERRCKMIFIGKNLNREELTSDFMTCMASCVEPIKGETIAKSQDEEERVEVQLDGEDRSLGSVRVGCCWLGC